MNSNMVNKPKKSSNEDIFLLDIWKVIMQKWWLVILIAFLCGGLAYIGTKLFIEPTYQSSFSAYVNNSNQNINNDSLSTADITAARNLTSTYATIITSQPDIEAAIRESGLDMTYSEISNKISVNTLNDTEIIRVSVVTTNPEVSYKIATSLQRVAPDYVAGIVVGSSMMVIEPANYPNSIYGPNYLKNTVLGAAVGVILLLIILFICEIMDNRIRGVDELSRYGIVVIGTVHDLAVSKQQGYGYYGYEKKGKNDGI